MTLVKSLYSGDPDVNVIHDRWCYSGKVISPINGNKMFFPLHMSHKSLSPGKFMCVCIPHALGEPCSGPVVGPLVRPSRGSE